MITASFWHDEYGYGDGFVCDIRGHAQTGLTGGEYDMICAAVSAIMEALVVKARSMEREDGKSVSLTCSGDKGSAFVKIDTIPGQSAKRVYDIWDMCRRGVWILRDHYPQHVKCVPKTDLQNKD